MNLLTHFKRIILPLLISIVFGCFWILPQAQALPGCFPNFTTAIGCNALDSLNGGTGNTGVGWFALFGNSTGNFNTAIGAGALDLNNADNNTAVGAAALLLNTSGTSNTATGTDALALNVSGSDNTAVGDFALYNNTGGGNNIAIGTQALFNCTGDGSNTAIGADALHGVTTGVRNIGIGLNAGTNIDTGDGNIDIDNDGVLGDIGVIRIGSDQTATFIAGISGTTTGVGDAIPVVIDSAGQLGTMSSSRRFKNEIKSMDSLSEAILGLKPVTFHYKSDKRGTSQFGLIAEEVAKVSPDLVVRDKNGDIYTVRYDAVNAMLLNEFLKEHKTVQEQGAIIARQERQIEALNAGLQKVSAQIQVSKSAPQTVVNNQ